jgi:hypothetical protein
MMATGKRHDDGSIGNTEQRQTRIESLPEEERELARECGRFADLCSYLSQRNVTVPPHLSDELHQVAQLEVQARAIRMKALNEELMNFLNETGLGDGRSQ